MNKLSRYFAATLALIPIAVMFGDITKVSTAISEPGNLFVILMSGILYIYMVLLAGSLHNGLWSVYLRFPIITTWILLGLEPALAVIVGGGLFVLIVYYWQDSPELLPLHETAGRIAIAGLAIIATDQAYWLLSTTPVMRLESPYFDYSALIPGLIVHSLVTHVVGLLVSKRALDVHLRHMLRELPTDILMLFIACIVPLIVAIISPIAYAVVNLITIAQATRFHNLQQAQQTVFTRMREITLLNQLGHQIVGNPTLDHVLNSTYEITQQINHAPLFFVALYQEERALISYPLVRRNGQNQQWQTRTHGSSDVVDYVIREQQSICINRDEGMRILKLGIEPASFTDAVYLCVPLMVGDKLIGVMGLGHPEKPDFYQNHQIELTETIAGQVSLAIRNVVLYERTTRLTQKLSTINQAIQKIMFNLDQNEGLHTACSLACEIGESTGAAIYTLASDHRLMLRQAAGFSLEELPPYLPDTTRQPRQDISGVTIPPEWQTFCGNNNLHSITQIPLKNGFVITGLLILFHEYPTLHVSSELNLLETLANQIGAALDNVDLLQALDMYASEQGQLLYLASISSSNLDLERILLDVCRLLGQMLTMPRIEIGLLQPEKENLQVYGLNAGQDQLLVNNVTVNTIPEVSALLNQSTLDYTPRVYALENATPPSQALQQWIEAHESVTVALVPLQLTTHSIGCILAWSDQPHAIEEKTRRVLEMAAHQITAQIHNATIYSITEAELTQRLHEISLIEEIATKITQSLDLPTIIQHVLEAAIHATQSTLAAIVLRSGISEQSYETIWAEQHDQQIITRRIIINTSTGITAHVIRTGEPMLVPNNDQETAYYAIPDTHYRYHSSLVVPLIKGERIMGVLNVENTKHDHFTQDHLRFIQSLAGHAAISIDNAYLLDDREYQINTLTQLRTLALDTLNVIRENEVAVHILRVTLTLLNASQAAIYRYDRMPGHFTMLSGASVQGTKIINASLEVPPQLFERAIRSGVLQIVSDASQSEVYRMSGYSNPTDYRSLVVIPIKRHSNIYELLAVAFHEPRAFSSRDVNTFDLLAVQVANHLENAALNEIIQDSNDQMRAILDANQDGIILLDTHLQVQDANAAAEQFLSLNLRQCIGEKFTDLLYGVGTSEIKRIREILQSGIEQLDAEEFTLDRKDTDLHLLMRVYPVTDGTNIAGHVIVLRDVTAEWETAVFREKIQSMVLHDLRSPLSSIISSIYLAMNIVEMPGDAPLDETLIPTLQISLDSANHLMQLVETLRDLPVIAEMSLNPEWTALDDLVATAINSLAGTLREADIQVTYEVDRDLPDVWVDRDLIRRVLINLLHNAFKFTPENGNILIYAALEPAPDGYLYISVSDTGPGIPPDQRERIFQEFVQIEGQKPRAGGRGMGLGLNFCKLAVEAHGGRIWVEPQGRLSGACFAFYLPYTEIEFNSDAAN